MNEKDRLETVIAERSERTRQIEVNKATISELREKTKLEIQSLHDDNNVSMSVVTVLDNEINGLRRIIDPPRVSDHAMLRYLERKFNLDMKEIHEAILSPKILAQYAQLGDGKFPIEGEELRSVIVEHTVVSVIPNKFKRR